MEFNVKTGAAEKISAACIVVGIAGPRRLSPAAESLDKACDGQLRRLLKQGDIDTECGKTTLIHHPQGNIKAARILVVGCGKDRKLSPKSFAKISAAAARALQASGATDAASCLTELEVEDRDLNWKASHTVQTTRDALYRFDELKSDAKPPKRPLKKLTLVAGDARHASVLKRAARDGEAIANGMDLR
jgi:leucyl aminopeptidase